MKFQFFSMMILTTGLMCCSADKASELFETAQFEELQNNNDHARQIYQDIIIKYPKSDIAIKADERLSAIGKAKKE